MEPTRKHYPPSSEIERLPTWIGIREFEGRAVPPWERKPSRWERLVRFLKRG